MHCLIVYVFLFMAWIQALLPLLSIPYLLFFVSLSIAPFFWLGRVSCLFFTLLRYRLCSVLPVHHFCHSCQPLLPSVHSVTSSLVFYHPTHDFHSSSFSTIFTFSSSSSIPSIPPSSPLLLLLFHHPLPFPLFHHPHLFHSPYSTILFSSPSSTPGVLPQQMLPEHKCAVLPLCTPGATPQ